MLEIVLYQGLAQLSKARLTTKNPRGLFLRFRGRTGKTAEQRRAQAALSEDPASILSVHVVAHNSL